MAFMADESRRFAKGMVALFFRPTVIRKTGNDMGK